MRSKSNNKTKQEILSQDFISLSDLITLLPSASNNSCAKLFRMAKQNYSKSVPVVLSKNEVPKSFILEVLKPYGIVPEN